MVLPADAKLKQSFLSLVVAIRKALMPLYPQIYGIRVFKMTPNFESAR